MKWVHGRDLWILMFTATLFQQPRYGINLTIHHGWVDKDYVYTSTKHDSALGRNVIYDSMDGIGEYYSSEISQI
jgi:hypothetical protein